MEGIAQRQSAKNRKTYLVKISTAKQKYITCNDDVVGSSPTTLPSNKKFSKGKERIWELMQIRQLK